MTNGNSGKTATFKLEMKIEGMTDGVGDRSAGFEVNIPPDDPEVANELWYKHFGLLFGDPEGIQRLAADTQEMIRQFKNKVQ